MKEIFYTDKSEFIPSLFSFDYPPLEDVTPGLTEKELPILARSHSILLHYIRNKNYNHNMNGKVFDFPEFRVSEIALLNNSLHTDQKVFTKRTGFISFNKKKQMKNLTDDKIKIIILAKDGISSYIILLIDY